jgi:hypothetical protein
MSGNGTGPAPSLSCDEINLLIQHYLQEVGYEHAAFAFACESKIPLKPIARRPVPSGSLVYLVQKGILFSHIETAAESVIQAPSTIHSQILKASQEIRCSEEAFQEAIEQSRKIRISGETSCFYLDDRSSLKLVAHSKSVVYIAWSKKDNRLATASMDGIIAVWLCDGEKRRIGDHPLVLRPEMTPPDVTYISWSTDGQILAVGMYCGTLLLCNENLIEVAYLEICNSPITSLAFHSESTQLLISDSSGKVLLLTDRKITTQWTLPDSVVDVLWEDDTKAVAASGPVVYELHDAEPRRLFTVKTMIIQMIINVLKKFYRFVFSEYRNFSIFLEVNERRTLSVSLFQTRRGTF